MTHLGFATVPAARIDDLVVSSVAESLMVYDRTTAHLHHLDGACATVWTLCDGVRSVASIAEQAGLGEEETRLAVARLADAGLLGGEVDPAIRDGGSSRRRLLRNAAAAMAVPAIVSITAPSAAMAATIMCGPNDQYIAHPTDCNAFYECTFGTTILRACPAGLYFNPILSVCDWPEDAGCTAG